MINRAQHKAAPDHEKIRDAVRAWSSALDNQDVVSALIINEYREQGGTAISFPEDISRARQKLFRFLDNRFDSEQYRENVRQHFFSGILLESSDCSFDFVISLKRFI